MKILVHSAAGGVGSSLVQLAKIKGCHVTRVVGKTHKVTLVENLGADQVIDKSKEKLWEKAESISQKVLILFLMPMAIQLLRIAINTSSQLEN